MGKILRTNVFTGKREWTDFDNGITRYDAKTNKTYSTLGGEWVSQSGGCHPEQVTEFNEWYKSLGIKAHHKKNGDLVAIGNASRNAVLKARGIRDNDACYGQWAGDASEPTEPNIVESLTKDREFVGIMKHAATLHPDKGRRNRIMQAVFGQCISQMLRSKA